MKIKCQTCDSCWLFTEDNDILMCNTLSRWLWPGIPAETENLRLDVRFKNPKQLGFKKVFVYVLAVSSRYRAKFASQSISFGSQGQENWNKLCPDIQIGNGIYVWLRLSPW